MKRTLKSIHLLALLLMMSCAVDRPDTASQFDRYARASASHDLATLEALTAEDVVWQFGPFTFRGKKEALGPNAHDAGAQTKLTYRDVKVDGNVVTFELIEKSEIISAVGMTELRHCPRFEFENGLVKHKGPSSKRPPAEYSLAELNRRMVPLRQWIRETHPELVKELAVDGRFVFSKESGALMLKLSREWIAAGAPGRLP